MKMLGGVGGGGGEGVVRMFFLLNGITGKTFLKERTAASS